MHIGQLKLIRDRMGAEVLDRDAYWTRQKSLSRAVSIAVVVGLHLFLVHVFLSQIEDGTVKVASVDQSIVWMLIPDEQYEVKESASVKSVNTATPPAPKVNEPVVSIPPTFTEHEPPRIDWLSAAERAASSAAASASSESVQEPPKRKPKPFPWNKGQTERFSAGPGGIVIRLNDRCQIGLFPLPIGGCVIGKIEARGDLFDEMDRPAELGDWKE